MQSLLQPYNARLLGVPEGAARRGKLLGVSGKEGEVMLSHTSEGRTQPLE
jgi:hypothetical protein